MSNKSNGSAGSRRRFILVSVVTMVAAPIARLAFPQAAEKVDENSPPAKALDYHHDASKVTNPKRKNDQFCHNCQFFQGKPKDQWGPCAVFQGKQVAAQGWCSTWLAKS